MHVRSFAGHVVGITFQALILAAIIAALTFGAVLVTGAPAGGSEVFAGKPGSAATAGYLSANPDPAAAYTWVNVDGCGFRAGEVVNIVVKQPRSSSFFPTGADSSGCVSFTAAVGEPGSYVVEAYQNLKGRRQTLMASDAFTVL